MLHSAVDTPHLLSGDQRQEARELIYETALEAAMADSIGPKESNLLTWLAERWNVPVRFADVDDES